MENGNLDAAQPGQVPPEEGSVQPGTADDEPMGWWARLTKPRTDPGDATRGEVMLYAFGNVENAIANQFFNVLKAVMVVAMHVNPLLIGLILGIKTLWDSVTDPIMAQITDSTRSRWGRRRPYILVGGVSRILILIAIVAFMPTGGHLTKNPVMEAQKFVNEGINDIKDVRTLTVRATMDLPKMRGERRAKLITLLEESQETLEESVTKIDENIDTLRGDVEERREEVEQREAEVAALREKYAGEPDLEQRLVNPRGVLEFSREKQKKAEELVEKAIQAKRQAIAAGYALDYLLGKEKGDLPEDLKTPEAVREQADEAYARAGLEPLRVFSMENMPSRAPPTIGIVDRVKRWFYSLRNPDDPVVRTTRLINENVEEIGEARRELVTLYDRGQEPDGEVDAERVRALKSRIETAWRKIEEKLPYVREQRQEREEGIEEQFARIDRIYDDYPAGAERKKLLREPDNLLDELDAARGRFETLLRKSQNARREAMAGELAADYMLAQLRGDPSEELATPEAVREFAKDQFAEADLEPLPVLELKQGNQAKKGALAQVSDGFAAFMDPKNSEQRGLIVYVLIAFLIFTTLTTVQSVPYYALGIELSPSYNGRTQVVTYRAIMDKIAGLIAPWVPVFCFSLLFATALQGLLWVAIFACVIGLPSTILMCMYTKERTHVTTRKKKAGLFASMIEIAKNSHFLRIFFLYKFIGLTNGIFQQIGFYLNVYWVMGSALSGATLGAMLSMLAWGLGFISLPLINWGCRKFQKHRVLGFAIIWMSIGTALKWWAMNPDHPEYQFILPFFFSIGIGSIYTVLPTMMADVTDVDELKHGERREGMFGAVMAFLTKMTGTLTPILAGAILVASGFDPALEYEQAPETIFRMRLFYSFIPAVMLLVALAVLWRYPLTQKRVNEVKEILRKRHEEQDKADAQEAEKEKPDTDETQGQAGAGA
jgi:GPH family glycoside/pentoside/hexuronide:cation symporter